MQFKDSDDIKHVYGCDGNTSDRERQNTVYARYLDEFGKKNTLKYKYTYILKTFFDNKDK